MLEKSHKFSAEERVHMWKNFKIRGKLLIGFIMVLAVFGASVIVSWSYLSNIREENQFITNRVIPAQMLCSDINDQVDALFMALYVFRADQTAENVTIAKQWIADIQKTMDKISAFHNEAPEIEALNHQINKVFPKLKEYFGRINDCVEATFKKNDIYKSLIPIGDGLFLAAQSFKDTLTVEYTKKERTNISEANEFLRRIDEITEIMDMLEQARLLFYRGLTSENFVALESYLDTLEENSSFKIMALKNMLAVNEQQRMLDDLLVRLKNYKQTMVEFIAQYRKMQGIVKDRMVRADAITVETKASVNLTQGRVEALSNATLKDVHKSMNILFYSAILAVLFGIMIAFIISYTIATPLSTIVRLAKSAGEGNLTYKEEDFGYKGNDELGQLASAISTMIISQDGALKQVVSVSDNLTSSAHNLSAISEEANASMEEVKGSIEQVSSLLENNSAALQESNAGIEELSAGADTVANSATDSAAFISQTTNASNRAIQTVNEVISGMHNVDKNAKESEGKMKQLVASVDNVSSFVAVITGIADQTNLLALNAAIEAARAGEVGRGFAVVAEEVRKLAEESARAAQNVNGIIVELQSGAKESIKATTNAGRMLGDTLVQAVQAQKELNDALKEMNKANDSIQNIAAVAEEQAASCREVVTAIDSATKSTMEVVNTISVIRSNADETAKAARGVAQQSEAMNGQADNLTEALSRFKLSETSTPKANKNINSNRFRR
jgi:methyl-accepting chemotaxis protein